MNGQMQTLVNKVDNLDHKLTDARREITELKKRVWDLETPKKPFEPIISMEEQLCRVASGNGPEFIGTVSGKPVYVISEEDLAMYEDCWEKVNGSKYKSVLED